MKDKQNLTAEAGWRHPRISQLLMNVTMAVGAIGYFDRVFQIQYGGG